MADVESAELFWHRLRSHVKFYDGRHGADFILPCIHDRDIAIREAARREAFEEAARVLGSARESVVAAARAQRPEWTTPLAHKAAGLALAVDSLRALATGKGAG